MTILSVNKTRHLMGAAALIFFLDFYALSRTVFSSCFFILRRIFMRQKTRRLTQAAIIAALYVVLTHLQNALLPGSATWAIQCRASEALCVLALFTPAAIPGLSIGCLLFNITFAAALPLDWLVGTAASFAAAWAMWHSRKITIKGYPLLALLMPALTNAFFVGWELTVYIGGSYPINALYVALGELIVLLTLGSILFSAIRRRNLDSSIFA